MEKKLKHLEFIQNTINRMSNNSFLIKGWCVTIISGVYVLAEKDINKDFVMISFFVILSFWFLDSFYLRLERMFRCLYEEAILKNENEIDFSMKIKKFNKVNKIYCALFSESILLFYLPLITLNCLLMYIIR